MGDVFDWRLPGGHAFRGTLAQWPKYLTRFVTRHAISDIILFGDCRPLHLVAKAIAQQCGIRVFIVEEGYLRPDWVTFSTNATNGHARLPKDIAALDEAFAQIQPGAPALPVSGPIPSSFTLRAWDTFYYYAATYLGLAFFPFYRSHRNESPIIEGISWLLRFTRRKAERARTAQALAVLRDKPFFLCPLQLNTDAQLRVHSRFGAMKPALEMIIQSFARWAPAKDYLAIKLHPLDPGLQNWRAIALDLAKAYGIGDRCVFLEDGDILAIVRAAKGVVTINSTTGTLSLAEAVPTLVLGEAVYNIPGICSAQDLDAFWCNPDPVDTLRYAKLKAILITDHLIRGGFHSDIGLDTLIDGALARLCAVDTGADQKVPQFAIGAAG